MRAAAVRPARPDGARVRPGGPPHPDLPGGRRLRAARGRRTPREQRVAVRAVAQVAAPPPECWRESIATRIRPTRACAGRSRTATGCRPSASPWATARATCCSRPARRCSSRAPSWSTRGRRSRCTRSSRRDGGDGDRRRPRRRRRHDLDRMAEEVTVATRMVIVCNPNNPTGTALPLAEIQALVERVPRHVCVLVDEAYCDFNTLDDPDASIDLLEAHPNLVLLRTFSKVHGLAALRVGFALCGSEAFRAAVDQVRQPFFCNAAAQAAATEALRHQDEVAAPRRARRSPRGWSSRRGSSASGSRSRRSHANFVWVHLRQGPRRGGDRPRRWPRAECSSAPAPRSVARARCGSRAGRPRRTGGSSVRARRAASERRRRGEGEGSRWTLRARRSTEGSVLLQRLLDAPRD